MLCLPRLSPPSPTSTPPDPRLMPAEASDVSLSAWAHSEHDGPHGQSWLPQLRAPAPVLKTEFAAGTLTPVKRRSGGRTLLDALVRQGRVPSARLPSAAAATWAPQMPMPYYLVQHLRAAPTLNAMLEGLQMPSCSDQAENNVFLVRCMSLYLQRGPSAAASRNLAQAQRGIIPQKLWRSRAKASAAATHTTPVPQVPREVELSDLPRHCMACQDTLDIYSLKFRMPGCAHPAVFDRDCYIRGLQSGGGHACPTPGCTSRLCADDLMAKGIEGAWVEALPERIMSQWQATQSLWRGCPTEHCSNGRLLEPDSRYALDCVCCGTRSILSTKRTLFNQLDENTQQYVFLLVRDALRSRSNIVGVTADLYRGLVRECYHCGVPTEQRGGCSHMKCRDCHRKWDFVSGEFQHDPRGKPSQMYVPRRSWLVELGLYQGLEPGKVYPAHIVAQTLVANMAYIEEEYARGIAFEQTRIVKPLHDEA